LRFKVGEFVGKAQTFEDREYSQGAFKEAFQRSFAQFVPAGY
jgi:hypothetical protein